MENLIKIVNFDANKYILYFNYIGDFEVKYEVRIFWNNLTLYFTEMTFGINPNTVYFVGFNGYGLDSLDHVEVNFVSDYNVENHKITLREIDHQIQKNINFTTDVKDPSYYTFNEIFSKKIYDDKLVRIHEGDIVVDVGANYGFFSFYAKGFKPSKIFALEPSVRIFNYLEKNVPEAIPIQRAVSGKSNRQKFLEDWGSSASNRLSDENGGYEVDVIGINDILEFLRIKKIDFLKIDCEGDERDIFETITFDTIKMINKLVVEFHSEEIREIILNKLNLFGFNVEKVTSDLIFSYNPEYFKSKKKIALVSTYCDTQEKKDIFLNLVKKVKSFGVDVIAISPLPLDQEHIEACDYLYFTKENPILTWPVRVFTFWKEYILPDGRILTMQRGVGDYSWAALYHVKKMTQIAMDYDYEIFYHMIYDLEIDNVVERALKDFEGNIVYPRRDPHHPETLWETTLHFMSFDRDLMKKIEKDITLEEYLSTNGVAEGEVLKWKNKYKIEGSEHPVKDLIFYWEGHDFFDYSPSKDFKMFISKNRNMDIWLGENPVYSSVLPSNLRITFYDFQGEFHLDLVINKIKHPITPQPFEYIEFEVDSTKIETLDIIYKQQIFELTESFKNISMNQIYYNHRP